MYVCTYLSMYTVRLAVLGKPSAFVSSDQLSELSRLGSNSLRLIDLSNGDTYSMGYKWPYRVDTQVQQRQKYISGCFIVYISMYVYLFLWTRVRVHVRVRVHWLTRLYLVSSLFPCYYRDPLVIIIAM